MLLGDSQFGELEFVKRLIKSSFLNSSFFLFQLILVIIYLLKNLQKLSLTYDFRFGHVAKELDQIACRRGVCYGRQWVG